MLLFCLPFLRASRSCSMTHPMPRRRIASLSWICVFGKRPSLTKIIFTHKKATHKAIINVLDNIIPIMFITFARCVRRSSAAKVVQNIVTNRFFASFVDAGKR